MDSRFICVLIIIYTHIINYIIVCRLLFYLHGFALISEKFSILAINCLTNLQVFKYECLCICFYREIP